MKNKIFFVILCLLIIPLVNAGSFDCEQVVQCGSGDVYLDSGSIVCENEVTEVFPESILKNFVLEVYDCSGTESFMWDTTTYFSEYLDSGYIYHNKTFFQTNYNLVCESSSQEWYSFRGLINDLHTLRENPIISDYSTIESGDCPDVLRDVINYPEQEDIPGKYKVLFPVHTDTQKIYEPAFEPVSTLNYIRFFENDFSSNRSTQQAIIDDTCYDDGMDPIMCHYLSQDSYQRNYIENFYDGIETVDLFSGSDFGSGVSLEHNMTAALKHHFSYGKKTPVYARMSIEWVYEYDGELNSFRGYHYTFLILGMYEAGGDWFYWVQYPEGDKYVWSEDTLYERWAYGDFDGYYAYYDSHPDNNPDFIIVDKGSKKEAYKEDGKYQLIKGEEYIARIKDNSSAWYHETDDPWVHIDVYNDGIYETFIKDVSEDDNYIDYNIDFINNGEKEVALEFYGKSGWEKVVKTVNVQDYDVFLNISPPYLQENHETVNISYRSEFPINISYRLDFTDSSIISTDFYSFQKNISQEINMSGIDTSYDEFDNFFTIVQDYCFINTSTCRDEVIILDILGDEYQTSQFTNYFGKKADFSPSIPDYCVVNKTCYIRDDNIISDFGNYYDFLGLGSVTDDYLIMPYSYYGYYIDDVYQGLFYPDNFGASVDYSNSEVVFEAEQGLVFDSIGNRTIQVCQILLYKDGDTIIDYDCVEQVLQVSEALGGGGVDGSEAEVENASHDCSWNLTFDNSSLGVYSELAIKHYWLDIDKDGVVDSELNICGGSYTQEPDCVDDFCVIDLDMDDFKFDSYCEGESTVYDDTDYIKDFDLYVCYDNSYMPCGDVGLSECMNPTGYTGSFSYISLASFDECIDESFIEAVNYSIMTENTYIDNIDDYLEGLWCEKVENVEVKCEFSCEFHDLDNDGVNDCIDECCGGDDDIDTDGDGIADYCDFCPSDIGEDEIDNDGVCPSEDNCPNVYNPNQYDTDGDGYGNACDICEGGDDDIDEDSDGVPDFCDDEDSDPGPDGDEGEYQSENTTYNSCNNGVKDQGETYIDYGGVCGTCLDEELSPLIHEIDVDYGGKCGQCDYNLTKRRDDLYYQMIDFEYPFNPEWCENNQQVLIGSAGAFLVILLLIIIFMIIFLIIAYQLIIKRIISVFRNKKENNK